MADHHDRHSARSLHRLTAKFIGCDVPPAQSAVIESVAEDDAAPLLNVTGCDSGGLTTVTATLAGVARSSLEIVAFS